MRDRRSHGCCSCVSAGSCPPVSFLLPPIYFLGVAPAALHLPPAPPPQFSNFKTKTAFYQNRVGHFWAFSGIKMGSMGKIILDIASISPLLPEKILRPLPPTGHFGTSGLFYEKLPLRHHGARPVHKRAKLRLQLIYFPQLTSIRLPWGAPRSVVGVKIIITCCKITTYIRYSSR